MSRSLYARLALRDVSRREALRAIIAGSAATVAAGCTYCPAARPSPARRRPSGRTVVIGAGFAGLACAHELTRSGFDVVVLEARARVGGRVLSFDDLLPGRVCEGGGELIGLNHPAWTSYAGQFGLTLEPIPEDETLSVPVRLGGKPLDAIDVERLFQDMDAALARLTELARDIDADEPWRSPDAERLDAISAADWIGEQDITALTRLALRIQFSADNGVDVERQSLLGHLAMIKGGGLDRYWLESETHRCAGGNQRLAHHLAESCGQVRLSTPVVSIEHDASGATVTTASGDRIAANWVVLAAPIGAWGRIRVDPALPKEADWQMGMNVKNLAVVRRAFWAEAGRTPDALGDGPISLTWEGVNAGAIEDPTLLVGFAGGSRAIECREIAPEQRHAFISDAIEDLHPGYKAHFVRSRFMDWPGDEWTRGSYSFPAPGEVTRAGPILRRGIGRLLFAGEHTCPKFVGYMEGALQSGIRAANQITGEVPVTALHPSLSA